MKRALELSEAYFREQAEPSLRATFGPLADRLAAGLVGNGSECFGYDDALSRDHDWGVEFYIWVAEEDREWLLRLAEWKRELWVRCPPCEKRAESGYARPFDPMTVGDFYRSLIGVPEVPRTIREWVRAPEEQFALATNGHVFCDPLGAFSAVREELLAYVPEDLRKKRLAACCMALAQTGAYNLTRCAKRDDRVTTRAVVSRFTDRAIAAVFLLNRAYRPYYKWAFRRMGELPTLGSEMSALLLELTEVEGFGDDALARRCRAAERVCALIVGELRRQGLVASQDDFMDALGLEIQSHIADPFLSVLPPQYDI